MPYFALAVLYQNILPNYFHVSLIYGRPGNTRLNLHNFCRQFLSLGESYLACDLGVGCGGERVSNAQFFMSGVKAIVMSCNTDSHVTGNKGRKTHFPFTFAKEVKRNRKNLGASHGAPKIVTAWTRCYLLN